MDDWLNDSSDESEDILRVQEKLMKNTKASSFATSARFTLDDASSDSDDSTEPFCNEYSSSEKRSQEKPSGLRGPVYRDSVLDQSTPGLPDSFKGGKTESSLPSFPSKRTKITNDSSRGPAIASSGITQVLNARFTSTSQEDKNEDAPIEKTERPTVTFVTTDEDRQKRPGTSQTIDTPSENSPRKMIEPTPMSEWYDIDEPHPEVSPDSYIPQPPLYREEPRLHYFNSKNRPKTTRNRVEVSKIFQPPVSDFWKDKFKNFNHLQSEMANMVAFSDDNAVVSAPTGSGKTAIFEMAIARFLNEDLRASQAPFISKARKIVYISPSKALCEERFYDWSKRLSRLNLGIEVAVVTGDGDPGLAYQDLKAAHLVLTTPEKLDSLTRRWTENFFLFGSIKLVLVDEVHLLGDPTRGACLEAVLCRLKSIQRAATNETIDFSRIAASSYPLTTVSSLQSHNRIVAVSATLPNISEIAAFLDANEAYIFDASYRPVSLSTHVLGMGHIGNNGNSQYMFWSRLDKDVPGVVHRFSNGRPTIVFCHSKRDTENLAEMLATTKEIVQATADHEIAQSVRVVRLQRVMLSGIAYHHAGLNIDDRRSVEKAFLAGRIRVLCATSTLAVGVNLPAHLVVIKGTHAYRGSAGFQAVDQASLLQMIGRAGRPGFDTSGTAIIMTDNESKNYYERLVSDGLRPADSCLKLRITEIVNTEVSQGVIRSIESAINWLRSSLYFIQLNRRVSEVGASHEKHLVELCNQTVSRLAKVDLLKYNQERQRLDPTPGGHVMSQHLVDLQTMELLSSLPHTLGQSELLQTIAKIEELQRPVRRAEKRILNELHKSLKYRLDGALSKIRIKEPWEKAFVLLQAWIQETTPSDITLQQETRMVVEYAERILSSLEEYSVRHSKNGSIAAQAIYLRRCITKRMWKEHRGSLGSLQCVGREAGLALQMSGISSMQLALLKDDAELERAAGRSPPFGRNLRVAATQVLQSSLSISAEIQMTDGSNRPAAVLCEIVPRHPARETDMNQTCGDITSGKYYTLVAHTNEPNSCILYKRNISGSCSFNIPCPVHFAQIDIHLIASDVLLDDKIHLSATRTPNTNRTFITTISPSPTQFPILPPKKQRDPTVELISFSEANSASIGDRPNTASPTQTPTSNYLLESLRPGRVSHSLSTKRFMPISYVSPTPAKTRSSASIVPRRWKSGPINRVEMTAPHYSTQQSKVRVWARSQREQNHAQQRAFSSKRENPFSGYRHDPNAAEMNLDALIERDQNQIVCGDNGFGTQQNMAYLEYHSGSSKGAESRGRARKRQFQRPTKSADPDSFSFGKTRQNNFRPVPLASQYAAVPNQRMQPGALLPWDANFPDSNCTMDNQSRFFAGDEAFSVWQEQGTSNRNYENRVAHRFPWNNQSILPDQLYAASNSSGKEENVGNLESSEEQDNARTSSASTFEEAFFF